MLLIGNYVNYDDSIIVFELLN